jgi:hypothetical protein
MLMFVIVVPAVSSSCRVVIASAAIYEIVQMCFPGAWSDLINGSKG